MASPQGRTRHQYLIGGFAAGVGVCLVSSSLLLTTRLEGLAVRVDGISQRMESLAKENEGLRHKLADVARQQLSSGARAGAGEARIPAAQPLRQGIVPQHPIQLAGNLDDLIVGRIRAAWQRPAMIGGESRTFVEIEMQPDGDITAARVTRSFGDAEFEKSVLAAIHQVGQIPEMQQLNAATFSRFYAKRQLVLRAEDLTK